MKDYEGLLSECCGAEIKLHDVCSACGEHCEPEQGEEKENTMKEKVTSLKWSKALVEAGVKVETAFVWVRCEDSIVRVKRLSESNGSLCPAPLCVELLSLLPDGAGLEKVGKQVFAWAKEDKYSYKEIPADNPADALAHLAIWLKNKGLLEGEG